MCISYKFPWGTFTHSSEGLAKESIHQRHRVITVIAFKIKTQRMTQIYWCAPYITRICSVINDFASAKIRHRVYKLKRPTDQTILRYLLGRCRKHISCHHSTVQCLVCCRHLTIRHTSCPTMNDNRKINQRDGTLLLDRV